jgi:type I restriction enzyme, S subunit
MEIVQKMPILRFPEFADAWQVKKLGDVAEVTSGGTPSTLKKEYWNGNIRWMNSGELNLKRVYEVENRITEIGLKNSSAKLLPINCVMIGLAGQGKTRGTVAINKIELCTNQSIGSILPNKNYVADYLYHNLDDRYEELRSLSSGDGGRGGLNLQIIKSLMIPFPALPEQQKIAAFLSALEQKLHALQNQQALLQQYKKGVMQQLFAQQLRFKAADGSDFEDWEMKKLGEVTYKTDKKNKDNIRYPVYSINNKEGFLPQAEQFEGVDSNSRGYDISLYKIINPNTFAYNPARINVGSIGYSGDLNNIIISSLYVCFKTKKEVNDAFLTFFLQSDEFNKSVLIRTEGGVRSYLFYENFSTIEISLPCLAEQQKIAAFLSAIDDKIHVCGMQLARTAAYKKGLLQQMFV